MKLKELFAVTAFTAGTILLSITNTYGQFLPDSTVNYFTLIEYYDAYYDSLVQIRGVENMQGTGFKDYLRWKWFYSYRHGEDGNLSDVFETFHDYHENFEMPEGYTDNSNWQFIGPFGIPLGHDDISRSGTGKGMMLSIWVDDGDHSLIYAGSHHGGVWKTIDGGVNWYPLNDDDSDIHGVNSITVDPNNTNVIYFTGTSAIRDLIIESFSAGVFKSVDGGDTWNQLIIPEICYPEVDWKTEVRKILISPDNPQYLFFLTYRNVFRSVDQGSSWDDVFFKRYFPWNESDPNSYGPHSGLFDFKVLPWDNEVAYLAGSEVFEISYPYGNFDTTDVSDEVFYAGLDPGDYVKCITSRCEISLHENFPNKVWFCYESAYIIPNTPTDDTVRKLRVVLCDRTIYPYSYDILYEDDNDIVQAGSNKLEFVVSPSNSNIFYMGGILLCKLDLGQPNPILSPLFDGGYPDECWLHVDIRDMQIYSDGNGNDTLFLADDSGITWGTEFESPQTGCDDNAWHWRHPCSSIENGLNITEFYGIGVSEKQPYLVAGGCQDINSMIRDGNDWYNFGIGDGSEVVFSPEDENVLYYTEWQKGILIRSNDKGANDHQFYRAGEYSYTILPLTLDPDDPSILYTSLFDGAYKLLKFTGVNNFQENVPPPEEIHIFSEPITALKIVKTGPSSKRFFVATRKYYRGDNVPPSSTFTDCIYYSDNGIDFIDISENLDACRYGFISDIEIHPLNPNKIWVSAALYSDGSQRDKIFTLTLPGASWQNYSFGLPAGMPVYKVKYVKGLGKLFALTDVGIFTNNLDDPQWYPFNNNLPEKIMIDMDINFHYHKLFCATYGRGLWETEIEDFCENTYTNVVINDQVDWTGDMVLHGDLVINSGGILTIDHCYVFMPEGSRIIVKQAGKLIVDGATITSGYPEPWLGIEVWGSEYYQNLTQHFGQIYLKNNAIIENAFVGITNHCPDCEQYDYSGGIIIATDAQFLNNGVAVEFMPFRNLYDEIEYPYSASFARCIFQFDQNHLENSEFNYFITMELVNGVRFGGCDFINLTGLTGDGGEVEYKYKTGIYSFGSQYYVDETCKAPEIPCPDWKPSYFYGLNYGIYAMGYNPVWPLTIKKSQFTNNVTAIYLSAIENATITSNDFYINNFCQSVYDKLAGLYLDYCTGFTVEENSFYCELTNGIFHNTGIVVKDAGPANNEIYNNYFYDNFETGITALNKNRGRGAYDGLVIKCNEFDANGNFDWCVNIVEEETISEYSGIAQYQGSNFDERSPAGNLFARLVHPYKLDYGNYVEGNHIVYFLHDPLSEPRVEPKDYYNPEYTIFLDTTSFTFIKSEACPSNLSPPGPDPELLTLAMDTVLQNIDMALLELNSWVDGGNTEQLISDIELSTPPEAYDLYSDLMIKSPYLSDTSLIESIQKEDVLNNIMIEDIMVANPHGAKSSQIQNALDQKSYPLSDEQRETIDQGKSVTSSREILESRVATLNHRRNIIARDLITLYKNDTVNSWALDSLISFINQENTPELLYQLIFIRLNEGDSLEASNLLNYIQENFDMNSHDQDIHQQYCDYSGYYSLLINSTDPDFTLDSTTRDELYILAEEESLPGVYARNILSFYDTLVYVEPYVIPNIQEKSEGSTIKNLKNKSKSSNVFRIYPNPALSYFVVEYELSSLQYNSLELQICDITGKVVKKIDLPSNTNHKVISTKALTRGLYLCKFVMNGEDIKTTKLTVSF